MALKLFGIKLGRGLPGRGVPIKRYAMLRNSRFVQFPRMNFGQEMTPHQVHWALQDALEDQGVADIKAFEPQIGTYWSKIAPGANGQQSDVADYCVFEGGLNGSRGEPVPPYLYGVLILGIFIGAMGPLFESWPAMLGGSLLALVAGLSISYWRRYRRGDVVVRYRGIYLQPEKVAAGNVSWRFAVDLMLSVDVKKKIGKPLVDPVYQFITEHLRHQIGESTATKTLPELISENPKDFEARFPVVTGPI